jgi:hypothetical protein
MGSFSLVPADVKSNARCVTTCRITSSTCRMALPCDTGNTGSARYTHATKMSSARKSHAGMPVACQSRLPLAQGKGRARVAATARIILASLAEWLRKRERESAPIVLAGVKSNARCVTRSSFFHLSFGASVRLLLGLSRKFF